MPQGSLEVEQPIRKRREPMRNRTSWIPCFAIATLAACAGDVAEVGDDISHDDARATPLTLEGAQLIDELAASPVRTATEPFVRLGIVWEARSDAPLEVSTSVDGVTWSEWSAVDELNVETEGVTSTVGSHDVPGDAAMHYRLRTSSGAEPTFLHVEFLDQTLADSIEDGEPVEDDEIGELTQALSVGGVPVNSRTSWGARRPRCVSSHSPNRITIHHTATPTSDSLSVPARLRQIQAFHQDVNGWCDIGYQYLVSRDGRLWKGRGARRLGAHVANNNTGNVGISVIGTYTSRKPTEHQLNRIAALVRGLHNEFNIRINSTRVKGHRDFGGTACPGNKLYDKLGTIRKRARNN
jgi:N-acetylmuramoyl-L-alanine amidase